MKCNDFVAVMFYTLIFKLCQFSASSKMLGLNEGQVCRKGKGSVRDYVCMIPKNCENLMKSLRCRNFPDVCSFQGYQPIICCPMTFNETSFVQNNVAENSNSADEKCREYSELQYSKKQALKIAIVGGTLAKPQEFPHMVILGFGKTAEEGKWGCGASLISDRWILTAAHCLTNSWGKARWARVGDLNIVLTTDDARPKDYEIVQHVLHPDYKPPSRYNDIALFRLKTNVEFSAYIKPICLNTDPLLTPPKQTALATGWGRTSLVDKTSDGLLKVDLDIIPVSQCNNSYFSNDSQQLQFGIIPDSMICAGSNTGDKDTCVGDSGGPLQIRNVYSPTMYTQFGVTSFGKFCGDKDGPGVYTRVSKYISWIEGIVWPKTV